MSTEKKRKTEKKSINSRFVFVREAEFLDRQTFARELNASKTVIYDIENSKITPSKTLMQRLAEKFRVNLNWLILGEGPMFRHDTSPGESPPDDKFRLAVPDVYALYEENQRLKAGQESGCPVCPVMRRLPEEARVEVEGFARWKLSGLEAQAGGAPRKLSEEQKPPASLDNKKEVPLSELGDIREWGPEHEAFATLPLYEGVAAGEPLETIDAGEVFRVPLSRLHGNPDQYFAIRVRGGSMINAGIHDGAIAVIRKDKCSVSGQIVLARHEGEYTIKRYIELIDGTAHLAYEDGTELSVEIVPGHWEMLGVFCFVG